MTRPPARRRRLVPRARPGRVDRGGARGERLTERQALAALLLPSANNIAIMLARQVAAAVRQLRPAHEPAGARRFAWRHTDLHRSERLRRRDESTPTDQLRLAQAASKRRSLRAMVRRARYRIAGRRPVHNTDTLLGTDGFVGHQDRVDGRIRRCFMFRSNRIVHGRVGECSGWCWASPAAT